MSAPILSLENSSLHTGIDLRRADGVRVELETALREGFVVSPEDSNALLTLVSRLLQTKHENAL